jgi:NADPH2:quinone reductase
MRAIRVHQFGGPDALRLEEIPTPVPGPGEVLVRLEAAGINFIDVYHRAGRYPLPLPFTLGTEGAGTVAATGPDVSLVKPGDRVAYTGVTGSYAEYALVPEARLVSLPDDVTAREAAAALLQGMTAQFLACSTYPLRPADVCLVHAAAGGVGLLLCQVAKLRGARVIGTVSTEAKADLARSAGADEVIRYTAEDFVAETKRLTGGKGVQVVYDSVGLTTFLRGFDVLAPRGMMVLYGQSSGPAAPLDPQLLAQKGSLFLTRPSLFAYTASRADLLERAGDVLGWVRSGRLRLRIGGEFPLAEAALAHRKLEGRETAGKLLLVP